MKTETEKEIIGEIELNKIYCMDCIDGLKKIPNNSVDAIVTDPPYGLEFMGKEWDSFKKGERKSFVGGGGDVTEKTNDAYMRINKTANRPSALSLQQKNDMQNFFYKFGMEAIRILKPGGFLLIMGGTRTYHRMTCGIEDAGFEIRDTIMWLYGSGFPKSLNIVENVDRKINKITKGNSEWEGWGTALKPSVELIVVARKPLSEKNVALNVLKWGTGGINIDACRIGNEIHKVNVNDFSNIHSNKYGSGAEIKTKGYREQKGRFPANIILDEEAGKMLDEQAHLTRAFAPVKSGQKEWGGEIYHKFETGGDDGKTFYDDGKRQGASRFFYCAKASKSERNFGCEKFYELKKDVTEEIKREIEKYLNTD